MAVSLTDKCIARIRREIVAGSLHTRNGPITESALCKRLGVSRVTIRRSLARLRDENILRSIPYKGYVFGPAAQRNGGNGENGDKEQSHTILLVRSPSAGVLRANEHEQRIWEGMSKEAERFGCRVESCLMPLRTLVRELRGEMRRSLRGVALEWYDGEVAETLLTEGLPAVMVEYMHEGLALDAVTQDNDGGMEMAVSKLWEEGHRRLGLVAWSQPVYHPLRRRAAFVGSLLRRGAVQSGKIGLSARFDPEGGREAAAALFDKGEAPTALILCHLEMAAGVFDELKARGLRPNQDIRIVAWGTPYLKEASLRGTPWSEIPLDLISWPREEMGRVIVRILEMRHHDAVLPPLRVAIPTAWEKG